MNINDPMYRRAEAMVLASLYFRVICGKHLGEIHMTYNLVEVCLHNAFDSQVCRAGGRGCQCRSGCVTAHVWAQQ